MSEECGECRTFHGHDHAESWMVERNKKIVLLKRAGLSFRNIAKRKEISLTYQQVHRLFHAWKNRVPVQESASLQVPELLAPVG
ncbi:hypothetical protein LCGC14_0856430 [marine sediment metagenome]|uniref:Uncharacterized protein n=1 Tax=marine sediment metagenome TaxID=412755 RepID=A0A0F9SFT7_9ZZZZ